MPREPNGRQELDHLAGRLGARLVAAEPVGWGDASATYRLSLSDGRSFAARRLAGPESLDRATGIARLMARLAEAGLPVPSPTIVETTGGPWLLTAWVEGETGANWLGDPARARHLADRMGGLAARLRAIDPPDLDLRGPSEADRRAAAAAAGIAFVHGDFVPVNVVMDPGGEIAAILDFEHAGLGPALLDVAWWGWVVRHHHPAAWSASWETFLGAAGLDPGPIEARLHELALRTLADRAATAANAETRGRWLDRLNVARGWTAAGGCGQAT